MLDQYEAIEIEERSDCEAIQAYLSKITGARTVSSQTCGSRLGSPVQHTGMGWQLVLLWFVRVSLDAARCRSSI